MAKKKKAYTQQGKEKGGRKKERKEMRSDTRKAQEHSLKGSTARWMQLVQYTEYKYT